MFEVEQLKERIIVPTLAYLNLYSESAVNLLLGTAAQESRLGTFIHQLGNGPAEGIYQMEPDTERDIQNNFLKYRTDLDKKVSTLRLSTDEFPEMEGNLYYATAMCRIHYLRQLAALPGPNDIYGLANYWKDYYNTHLGAGTVDEFIHNYERYILGE